MVITVDHGGRVVALFLYSSLVVLSMLVHTWFQPPCMGHRQQRQRLEQTSSLLSPLMPLVINVTKLNIAP